VKCSLEAAELRDPKGLYQQAKDGKIEMFTGVNHPFQDPLNPEIVVNTERRSPEQAVEHIMSRLDDLDVLDKRIDEDYKFKITVSKERELVESLRELDHL